VYRDLHLLGDSGYACMPYLLTPVPNPTSRAELNFNRAQISTRNTVERQYGVWKRRFPVLDLGIRSPYMLNIQAIITATAVLHNIALNHGNPEPADDAEVQQRVNVARVRYPAPIQVRGPQMGGNTGVRDALIRNHFTN
jgi:hypothetical protein